jgi:hypothetical protein
MRRFRCLFVNERDCVESFEPIESWRTRLRRSGERRACCCGGLPQPQPRSGSPAGLLREHPARVSEII